MATRLSRREGLEQVTTTPPAVAERVPPAPLRGRVSKFVIPQVIFGVGTLAEVGAAVHRVGGRRPMLVSDPGVMAAGWVERAAPYLADVSVQWRLWHDLTPNPKDFEVQAAFESYVESGCDALLAAVSEACDFLSEGLAIAAIRGIVEHLPVAVEYPLDLTAREGMARASLQAGMAFTNALLGATHAIAHQIGGALDLPHGLLNAILMPHVMRFNAETHADRYVDVAGALGVVTDRLDARTAAERAIERVEELSRALGIPAGLNAIGVDPADFDT